MIMSWYDYLIIYLTSSLTLVMIIMSYNNLIKSKLELNKKLLLVSSIGGVFITLNIYNSEPIFKLFISFMIIFVSTVLTNNENVSKVFVNVVICFLLMLFWEVVTSAAVVLLKIGDMNTFDQSTILKSIMSFINLTFVYMVTSRKRVIGFASKISNKVKDNRLIISVLVLSIIILIIADVKYFESFSKDTYYSNLIIFVCIMIIIII